MNRLTRYQGLFEKSRGVNSFKQLVGVVQITSGLDTDRNFEKIREQVEICADQGAKLVCLPENFNYMGRTYEDDIRIAE